MLDFQSVRDGKTTFEELVKDLAKEDLRDLTNEMVDTMLGLIADAGDEDVVFTPRDAGADDPYAANDAERNISWTLGPRDRPHHGLSRRIGLFGGGDGARRGKSRAIPFRNPLGDGDHHRPVS